MGQRKRIGEGPDRREAFERVMIAQQNHCQDPIIIFTDKNVMQLHVKFIVIVVLQEINSSV